MTLNDDQFHEWGKKFSYLSDMKSISLFAIAGILFFCSCRKQAGLKQNDISTPFEWQYADPESQGMSAVKLSALVQDLSSKGTRKLLIIRNDKIVCEWFAPGFEDSVSGHYTASLAKAIVGGMSLIAAIQDGYILPDEPACNYIPSWKVHPVKSKITIRQLATHTSGMEDSEVSETEGKQMLAKGLHRHMDLPGWKGQFWRQEPDPFLVSRDSAMIISTPGTRFIYSNPGIAMMTFAVTASLKKSSYRNIRTYLKERIYDPVGIKENEYTLGYGKTFELDGISLVPSWGGANFTAGAVARIGRLMLRKGNWDGTRLIDSALVEEAIQYKGTGLPALPCIGDEPDPDSRTTLNPVPATTLGWYSNYDGVWKYVPRDAFAGAGAENQLLLVVPSLDLIIVRFGADLFDHSAGEGFWLGAEKYLFNPVIEAVEEPPYPESDLISHLEFAPLDSVIQLAEGSDNWPLTWGEDGDLYTAYGDGNGFLPGTEIKLSLGLARISGNPPGIKGINLRSPGAERVGEGKFGPKASGMLMVKGTLYMLIRNLQNARLAWSDDHGESWEWADWQFGEGFGCPTFLNYGKNYEDAKDQYVYIYSPDGDNAYDSFDNMMLARVPVKKIKNWKSYEYFAGFERNKPVWTEDLKKRRPVFVNPGKCYRSGITYNNGLKRYIWCQIIQVPSAEMMQGPRFRGGIGIYESPHPWGPWKTVYYTMNWDTGPGETASLPVKWMSRNGKNCYLVFSGNDHFSVRKVMFHTY
jgi:CubicO group peptidase (beta-lactamase class C family)